MKKYISPNRWFSFEYPDNWNEFEDTEETFLFYNPNQWNGNFRISAYRDSNKTYGLQSIEWELEQNPASTLVKIGEWDCAYSTETFQENGAWYTTHIWITGKGNISLECSFTVAKGGERLPAENIIRSLAVCKKDSEKEIIPIRLLEIYEINSAFEWVSNMTKKILVKDFTPQVEDIVKLQELVDSGKLHQNQRVHWKQIGLALGSILKNEIDGIKWVSVIEEYREYPALQYKNELINPANLVWNKIKNGHSVNLKTEFEQIMERVGENK